MKRRIIPALFLAMLAVLVAVPLGGSRVARAQTPPARFFGALTLDGAPAPAGTEIVATTNGVECGRVTTTDAGKYVIDVASSGSRQGCGNDGDTVSFTVAGNAADQTGTFALGNFISLDLSASAAASQSGAPATPAMPEEPPVAPVDNPEMPPENPDNPETPAPNPDMPEMPDMPME